MGYKEQFILSMAFTGIVTLILGFFVFFQNVKNKLYIIFSLYSLSIAWWSLTQIGTVYGPSLESSWFWSRVEHIGVAFIPTLFLHFVISFLDLKNKKWMLFLSYVISIIFVSAIPIKLIISNTSRKHADLIFYGNPGPFYTPLVIFFITIICYCLWKLFNEYNNSRGVRRSQLKYLCWGSLFGYIGGSANYFLVYDISIPILNPYGTYFVGLGQLAVGYAIIHHQLMEIEVVIKKTLVFASLFAIVFGIFIGITLLTQELVAEGRLLGLAISSIAIILAVRPLENFLIGITDKYLFQKKYDYQQVLKSFIDEVITVLDLNIIVKKTLELLDKMFHPDKSAILLLDNAEDKYILHGNSGFDNNIILESKSKIPHYLKTKRNILSVEDRNIIKMGSELKDEMDSIASSLAMPLLLHDELIGIVLLGKKKSDVQYTKEDLDILTDLAQTEAIAISNSRTHALLIQAREKEQQSEYLISLGFVVTNISHELRNPIHIISSAAETTLDAIDAELNTNALPEKNRKTIDYIKIKLKSIMEKSDKTHEMLESILHAVKITPENFTELDIKEIAHEAVTRIEPYLKPTGVKVITDIPAVFPKIKADRITIEQVFVNLLTNAMQVIELSKKGDRICITAADIGEKIRIEISDNGPGISEQDIKRIFEPFYTSKDNLYAYKTGRSKGVGLGLMIVYQTIAKHNGTIHVESKEGEGAAFIIELPKVIKG